MPGLLVYASDLMFSIICYIWISPTCIGNHQLE